MFWVRLVGTTGTTTSAWSQNCLYALSMRWRTWLTGREFPLAPTPPSDFLFLRLTEEVLGWPAATFGGCVVLFVSLAAAI